ncbi:sugar phosphate isomerase/epimerase family protein [Weissella halotolerans]|uniref:Sugar phosphate isomerase epimerase n=1 Tax=Weissella halotolerans DSM 20190 TaxID=1123500 RepID=A0A0R2G7L3_9LACO|nr:sugar phosphate isomerase [Weissella halotolerans]KRN33463.1 sugar phosphate isomerase epimerase [Weissella halotolerans DSM 20190]
MAKLFLNTWVFLDQIKAGRQQAELVPLVAHLGASGIEIRREYLQDRQAELPKIREATNKYQLALAMSIPDELFVDGQLNPELPTYIAELKLVGASKAKFNLGDFSHFKGDLVAAFANWPDDIALNIENDQTATSGQAEPIANFLRAAQKEDLKIGYVYDLGNWAYTKGDAVASAKLLAPWTDYIHLKNVAETPAGLAVTTDLNQGLFDWRQIYRILGHDKDVALEFPMPNQEVMAQQVAVLTAEGKDQSHA